MNITVNLSTSDEQDPWTVARGILESIEKGAGGHCLRIERGNGLLGVDHLRLGVSITVHSP